MMAKTILIIITLLALFAHQSIVFAVTVQKPSAVKAAETRLREPKLKKKSALHWIKTTGIVAGTTGICYSAYWLATRENDLPQPPAFPQR